MNKSSQDIYEALSSEAQFLALVKLSPSTWSIDVLKTDTVYLSPSSTSYTATNTGQAEQEPCPRLHFKLIEQVRYFGISIRVVVLGTQIMSRRQKLHIYESSANNGQVKIHKLRNFLAHGDTQTLIQERIEGSTTWIMSGFIGRECRRAHAEHVSRYSELTL